MIIAKIYHFVGSIAFYLKEELQQTFDKYDLQLGNVLRRPIDGLLHIISQINRFYGNCYYRS
jgi:hypothetical protein